MAAPRHGCGTRPARAATPADEHSSGGEVDRTGRHFDGMTGYAGIPVGDEIPLLANPPKTSAATFAIPPQRRILIVCHQ
jgi:hypothetical protein